MKFKSGDLVTVTEMREISKVNTYGEQEDCYEFLDEEAMVDLVDGEDIYLSFINYRLNRLLERVEYVFKEDELEFSVV